MSQRPSASKMSERPSTSKMSERPSASKMSQRPSASTTQRKSVWKMGMTDYSQRKSGANVSRKSMANVSRKSMANISRKSIFKVQDPPSSTEEGQGKENPDATPLIPSSAEEASTQDQGPRLSPICATYKLAEEPFPTHHLWFFIRRKKTTIFMSGRDDMSIEEMKETIESITKVPVADQRLFKGTTVMKNDAKLYDYGFGQQNKPQNPFLLGLVFKTPEGDWEELDITPYTPAPELPPHMTKEMFK